MYTIRQDRDAGNGTCSDLTVTLKGVTYTKMVEAFGPPNKHSYYDPDSGYDGQEWYFDHDVRGHFGIGFRYGFPRVRVGLRNNPAGFLDQPSPDETRAFVAWILEQIS